MYTVKFAEAKAETGRLKIVDRETFKAYVQTTTPMGLPVEGVQVSVMQFVSGQTGCIVAQAEYWKSGNVVYKTIA